MTNAQTILLTFSFSIVIGIILVLISSRLRIPAILLLLLGGISLGPYGCQIINPQSLGKDGLKTIVALAIGLILFEGALTLEMRDYKKISREIKGLLSIGVVVTWLATSLAIFLLFPDFSISLCLMASSLVIVTGPTVIGPLLKRIHIKKELTHILHWESILIDPIGVFIALLCYEIISVDTLLAFWHLTYRIIAGILVGYSIGWAVSYIINKNWIPQDRLQQAVLGCGIAIFAISDAIMEESGLLSVIVAGLVLNYYSNRAMQYVRTYKAQLIEILIGLLFMLLGANLNIQNFLSYGWNLAILVAIVMWVVRPLNIFISTYHSKLSLRDKLFLCWIAPRGIVAASMATLTSITLASSLGKSAQFLETFTFSIIAGTVIIQASTSYFVAKILDTLAPPATGWLIVGAHKLGQGISQFIQKNNQTAILLDTDNEEITDAQSKGLTGICGNALNLQIEEYPELYEVGNVLAITPNSALNELICQYWYTQLPGVFLYAWKNPKSVTSSSRVFISTTVWNNIDIRTLIDQQELWIKISEQTYSSQAPHPDRVLFYSQGNKILPFLPSTVRGNCTVLEYNLKSPTIYDLRTSWIIFYEKPCEIKEAITQLLKCLTQSIPKLPNKELVDFFYKQEQNQEGLVGDDIAFFHTYTYNIEKPIVAIARFLQPNLILGQSIHTIFIIISPHNSPQQHLSTISSISQFLSDSENLKKWKSSKSGLELIELLS